jgi:hypothetical protein
MSAICFNLKTEDEEGFLAQKACDGKSYLAPTKRAGRKTRASQASLEMTRG